MSKLIDTSKADMYDCHFRYYATCQGWSTACTFWTTDGDQRSGTPSHKGFMNKCVFSPDSTKLLQVDTGHTGGYEVKLFLLLYYIVLKVSPLPKVSPCI